MFKSLPEPKDINRHDFYSALKNEDFKEVVDRFYEKVHYESRIKKVIINILRAFKRYRFNPFRCIRFIYYNLFCENIDIDLADSLFLVWDSVDLDLKKGSKIKVKGICTLGKKYGHRGIIHLGENSELSIDTITSETSSFDLTLGESARLNIGHRTIIGNSARVSAVKKVSPTSNFRTGFWFSAGAVISCVSAISALVNVKFCLLVPARVIMET